MDSYKEVMGTELTEEVERQLLEDLRYYNISGNGLVIDWSEACGEGHCTSVLGGELQSASSIIIRNASGKTVSEGWIDFIHGGGDNPLFVFWNYLYQFDYDNGFWYGGKPEPFLPEHIWERLPESSRDLCMMEKTYDNRWANDPHIRAWRQERVIEPVRPLPGYETISKY